MEQCRRGRPRLHSDLHLYLQSLTSTGKSGPQAWRDFLQHFPVDGVSSVDVRQSVRQLRAVSRSDLETAQGTEGGNS